MQQIVSQKEDMSVGKRPPSVGDSREARWTQFENSVQQQFGPSIDISSSYI